MKTKSIASVVVAFMMMAGTCAQAGSQVQQVSSDDVIVAQRSDYRGDRRDGRYERREDRYDRRGDRYSRWRDDAQHRRNDRIEYRYEHRYEHRQAKRGDGRRGAGPRHDMYKGTHLPRYYRSRHYRIRDWRGHGLYAPPRGHYWAQVGADYVLVAITTAVILDMILHH